MLKMKQLRVKYMAISALFLAIGLILFHKYIELKNIVFDGDGIGIYLLGIEINDRVTNEQVATYEYGFFMASVLCLVVIFIMIYRLVKSKNHIEAV